MLRLFILLAVVAAFPACASKGTSLVGSWKLVLDVEIDDASGAEVPLMGKHPNGWLIFKPSGRMMALVTKEGRDDGNEKSAEDALSSMVSYTGRYHIEGNTLTTKVDAAWLEAWVGTEQKRSFELKGDQLRIMTMSQPGWNGRMQHATLTWEREK
ncbi:MAG TPA: lipocalin-like domain-containing protein [Alphaproteobacteria bacterium]|nr:lipocalin-like domain-containing protein [Alphaproteobacteria bacterium]